MSYWMIIDTPSQPVPIGFWYLEDMESAEALSELHDKSEEEGRALTLWKLMKHTTVDVNASLVDD